MKFWNAKIKIYKKIIPRHKNIDWAKVESKLKANPEKLAVLYGMEETGRAWRRRYNSTKDEYILWTVQLKAPKGEGAFVMTLRLWFSEGTQAGK